MGSKRFKIKIKNKYILNAVLHYLRDKGFSINIDYASLSKLYVGINDCEIIGNYVMSFGDSLSLQECDATFVLPEQWQAFENAINKAINIYIGNKIVKFKDDGSIQVGRITIPNDDVERIISKRKYIVDKN